MFDISHGFGPSCHFVAKSVQTVEQGFEGPKNPLLKEVSKCGH